MPNYGIKSEKKQKKTKQTNKKKKQMNKFYTSKKSPTKCPIERKIFVPYMKDKIYNSKI